jgi:RNA polymerase sigma-70 factor (ECF subfamily)
MLRSRESRREDSLGVHLPEPVANREGGVDPEQEALLADSVGLALLVVLDTLAPAERVAFVLHDLLSVPFDEIAPIVGREPAATRQLASRARRRVQGAARVPEAELTLQREVVNAFLAALRGGDLQALLAMLDPSVVVRADRAAVPPGTPTETHGAQASAAQALALSRGARLARPALVDGNVGLVVAPLGRLRVVLRLTLAHGKISQIEVVAAPERLRQLELAVVGAAYGQK